ncbi:MAG: vWA domain-containing protein [Pirellulaceae bacterium]|nr:VWA domain-containing protein [Planctomycetales bacterium]
MVAELIALAVFLLALAAELLHAQRSRKLGQLAFGPNQRPRVWVPLATLLKAIGMAAMTWALITLWQLAPKVHKAEVVSDKEQQHIVLLLDVSPSMRLHDAGPQLDKSRTNRAQEVLESFFRRVPIEQYRLSVVAFYTGAKPVVIDTKDVEVVRNMLTDLPMYYAFDVGETDLFAGLEVAAEISRHWNPRSTRLVIVSDGDSVPPTGMPKLPASIEGVVVVGVGDPQKGQFINGRNSRQEVSLLRQVAIRLGGSYHNGNERHLSSDLIEQLAQMGRTNPLEKLTKREYALIALGVGGGFFALLPLALHFWGTAWRPGVRRRASAGNTGQTGLSANTAQV